MCTNSFELPAGLGPAGHPGCVEHCLFLFAFRLQCYFFPTLAFFLFFVLFILIHKSEYVSGFLPYGIIVCETDEVLCIRFYILGLSAQN